MAERARARRKAAKTKGLKGKVATMPKQPRGKKARRAGHNSGEIPTEIYERHLAKIDTTSKAMEKAKEAFDQAKGVHQSAYKAAKNDGCDTDAIRLARKLDKADHGVTQVTYANVARILNIMGSPLGEEQLNLFGAIENPGPKVDVALQGQSAGKNGEPAENNPHTPGSDDYQVWFENWQLGQAQLGEGIRPN